MSKRDRHQEKLRRRERAPRAQAERPGGPPAGPCKCGQPAVVVCPICGPQCAACYLPEAGLFG
jgi:hypothetical protein